MSEVAGKIATQAGAFMLEKPLGGRGILLGGVPGVAAAKVMVIGGGVVGMNAAFIAIGMEATVYVYDRNIDRLRELDIAFGGRADTCYASTLDIEKRLPEVDLVIGAVLVHGAKAPYVIRREQLKLMKKGAVLVDVSIDQGGCFETSRPTTHTDPTYEVDGVTHYCVANMPGAVPITCTYALTNATLPYILHVADAGVEGASRENPGLAKGVNVVGGKVTYAAGGRGDRPRVHRAVRGAGRAGAPPEARRRDPASRPSPALVTRRRGVGVVIHGVCGALRRRSAEPAVALAPPRLNRAAWRTSACSQPRPRSCRVGASARRIATSRRPRTPCRQARIRRSLAAHLSLGRHPARQLGVRPRGRIVEPMRAGPLHDDRRPPARHARGVPFRSAAAATSSASRDDRRTSGRRTGEPRTLPAQQAPTQLRRHRTVREAPGRARQRLSSARPPKPPARVAHRHPVGARRELGRSPPTCMRTLRRRRTPVALERRSAVRRRRPPDWAKASAV